MTFSERNGYSNARSVVQVKALDKTTRIAIWNVISKWVVTPGIPKYAHVSPPAEQLALSRLFEGVWCRFLGEDVDGFTLQGAMNAAKSLVYNGEWYSVYDFIEFLSQDHNVRVLYADYDARMNIELERCMCGYRIVDRHVIPVTSEAEVSAIECAALVAHDGARDAIERAISDLSNRQNPDYADAVSQAISAVEAIAGAVTGKHTLGESMKELKKTEGIHPALADGWGKIYGFTSDSAGIRHGGSEAASVSADLARYFLVTCSAMVNLLAPLVRDSQ